MIMSGPHRWNGLGRYPTGDEQDAQQDRYQRPQDEQANEAKLGIPGRWQQHERSQYQSREAKGCVACHYGTFRFAL